MRDSQFTIPPVPSTVSVGSNRRHTPKALEAWSKAGGVSKRTHRPRVRAMMMMMLCSLALLRAPLRAPPAAMCGAAPSSTPGLRQRLKEVNVDPTLSAEVSAVVTHRSRGGRRGGHDERRSALAGLPLNNPFGAKPRFVASAARISSLPAESLPEIAFIGRSNVGKSSLLNALTGVGSLAKVSDKPGRTQKLNVFELGRKDKFSLVDMPGYGFAFAKDEAVAAWRELSADYLRSRKTLKLVLVLLDARVGLKPSDLQMLAFLEAARVKYTLVFTKADGAGPPTRTAQLASLTLANLKGAKHFVRPAAIVSARTGAGVGRLQRRLMEVATGTDPMAEQDGGWNLQQRRSGGAPRTVLRGARTVARSGGRGLGRGGRGSGRGRGRAAGATRVIRGRRSRV